jgi:hypothetical protein
MKKLFVTLTFLAGFTAFGQLSHIDGFKKNSYDLYEMTFKDVREAILKYNEVSDKNGADTSGTVYNVLKNPIDFAFFKNDTESDQIIVSILFRDGNKYKIMFGEFNDYEDKIFFDVIDENGKLTQLTYRTK